jgi:GNAT superfamily N-acetyltransferase
MVIRAAQPADAAAIAKVHVDSWRTTYRGIVPDDFLATLSYEQRTHMWRSILSQSPPTSFVYVAEESGGQVIGFASGGPEHGGDPDYTGELYAIYLLEGYQRHGLGRHLTSTLVQRLVQAGMPSLLLWVLAANPCRAFYEVLGGQPLYDKHVLIGGTSLVEVAYGWRDAHALLVEPLGE